MITWSACRKLWPSSFTTSKQDLAFLKGFCQRILGSNKFYHGQSGLSLDEGDSDEVSNASQPKRILRIAVIGLPNAGKSTLINQIMERRVCATSMKVHTTDRKARAIDNTGNTQLVFLDTPGLVTQAEIKRHSLQPSFSLAPLESVKEADMVTVVHDVSNKWTRDFLHRKLLFLLNEFPDKHSILILNKVDALKNKRFLLGLTEKLTKGRLKSLNCGNDDEKIEYNPNDVGWGKFSEIFMVSALTGEGVGDIKEYMIQNARLSPWLFDSGTFTDQQSQQLVEDAVREKLLDNLPQEIPYNVSSKMEFFAHTDAGLLCISVVVICKFKRHQKMLLGHGGNRVRIIAKEAEQSLANCYRCPVKLNIVVECKEDLTSRPQREPPKKGLLEE
ncbi:GTPase Era, mitochondrial [Cloeon dipterum]|uniref:GTPase Era, mitochondrial n=1 Tax=Cloeon dipterum TaxID=197152 RepID=UPI0032209B49